MVRQEEDNERVEEVLVLEKILDTEKTSMYKNILNLRLYHHLGGGVDLIRQGRMMRYFFVSAETRNQYLAPNIHQDQGIQYPTLPWQ